MKIILNWLRKIKYSQKKSISRVFTNIYKHNKWNCNESRSGTGSVLSQTLVLRQKLPELLKQFNIKSVLDIPCGDFNWMQLVNLGVVQYIGADIVKNLIDINNAKYSNSKKSFEVLDIVNDKLPTVDLIFSRDVFVHFPFHNINRAIKNIKKSRSKYLITTTFIGTSVNKDITIGEWRTLNLQKSPFNFPEPLFILMEECTQDDNQYPDKAMAMWEIASLNDF